MVHSAGKLLCRKRAGHERPVFNRACAGVEGGAPSFIPHSQRMLPQEVEGIRVYQGIEVNILDHQNHLDIPEEYLKLCEFVIASIHSHMFPEKMDQEQPTPPPIWRFLKNPYVDIIGHADDPSVPCDFEAIVQEAQHQGKLLELNNNSTTAHRPGSLPSLKQYILCCQGPQPAGLRGQ